MMAAFDGHTDIAIALLKAKANINVKNQVCVLVSLVGWWCVCRG